MRRHLSTLAALTLAGSLAGASLAMPATAATPAPASATRTVAAPQSPLKTVVQWNRTVRRGGTITYSLKSTNKGEWPTDLAAMFGTLPKGASKMRVVSKASSTFCDISGRDLFCLFDTIKPNRSTSLKVKVWLKRSTKGTAVAEFASISVDVPEGVDVTNEEELEKLDLQDDVKFHAFKTKILR
ncbi:hypothetical protein GCM10022226_08910 [Sphaerisporangium flaviroseum]|uniref:DUF11 domain-containing protein n=1 Tax=Sphaerisporangium flaviroseum TaxID=509199 RepID=A0ABP7HM03_9ACTN